MSGEVNNEAPVLPGATGGNVRGMAVTDAERRSDPTLAVAAAEATAAYRSSREESVTKCPESMPRSMSQDERFERLKARMLSPDMKLTNPKDRVGMNKAGMSVVPVRVIAELGVAMTEGALKYGPYNYRESGVRGSIYFDATLRHLFAWWEGEDIDPDSGLSHVAKAIASLAVLRDGMMQGNWTDDRAPKVEPFYPELHEKTQALKTKYPPS